MTGPLKRTNLRSSPEDAAFFRQFHDHGLCALRKGTPRQELLQDLVGKGVPEHTAERIVVAVELEHGVSTGSAAAPPRRAWKLLLFVLAVWGAVGAVLVRQMTRDGPFHWKSLVGAGLVASFLSARVVFRSHRALTPLPPPTNPGDR